MLQLFGRYLKERWKGYLAVGFLLLLVYVTAVLYQLPEIARRLRYALLLVSFCSVCGESIRFIQYFRHQKILLHVLQDPAEGIHFLPPPEGLLEERYQELLVLAAEENQRLRTEQEGRQQDMTDYYSMWVHQVKTPIAAMHLLLKREEQTGGHALEEELFKIEQYVDMALHYVRLPQMSSDLVLKEYAVDDLIRSAARKSSVLFIGSGLTFELEETGLRAVTDEKWFTFIMGQLLSNAVKYTKEGGIRIYADKTGSIVTEDTGIGIPDCDLPRIFERGFTGYNGRMQQKSTGIGLYLCRQAANGLALTLRAESEVGRGTRMILTFLQQPSCLI